MYANWWGLAGNAENRDKYAAEFEKLAEDLAKSDSWVRRILGFDISIISLIPNLLYPDSKPFYSLL